MSTYKNFDIDKAYTYLHIYHKNKQRSKQKLIEDLILLQNIVPTKNIVGSKIIIPCHYHLKTVENVLNDLGYTVNSYSTSTSGKLYSKNRNKSTSFSFVPTSYRTTKG